MRTRSGRFDAFCSRLGRLGTFGPRFAHRLALDRPAGGNECIAVGRCDGRSEDWLLGKAGDARRIGLRRRIDLLFVGEGTVAERRGLAVLGRPVIAAPLVAAPLVAAAASPATAPASTPALAIGAVVAAIGAQRRTLAFRRVDGALVRILVGQRRYRRLRLAMTVALARGTAFTRCAAFAAAIAAAPATPATAAAVAFAAFMALALGPLLTVGLGALFGRLGLDLNVGRLDVDLVLSLFDLRFDVVGVEVARRDAVGLDGCG